MVKVSTFISCDHGLVITRRTDQQGLQYRYGIKSGKEKFLFKFFLEQAEEKVFFRNTLLDSTVVTFSLYVFILSLNFFRSPFKKDLPSYIQLLRLHPSLHLEGCRSFFRYLSHHYLSGGGRVGCRLWGHCSEVILPSMRQAELICTLNVEVMSVLSRSFLLFFLISHYHPPRPPPVWPLWLISRLSRSICSLGQLSSSISLTYYPDWAGPDLIDSQAQFLLGLIPLDNSLSLVFLLPQDSSTHSPFPLQQRKELQ